MSTLATPRAPWQAVLFDHDGTLVDSEPVHLRLWQQVLEPLGVQLDEETYRTHHAGLPTHANADLLVRQFNLRITPSALTQAKHEATAQWLTQQAFPLMPDAHAALTRLRAAGLRLAVVTGSERAAVRRSLQAHALESLFDVVVSAEDVARNKPEPDGYQLAMRRLGLSPGVCVAVEDTEIGLRAACAAGLRTLAMPHGLSAHHNFGSAHRRFEQLRQVADWLLAPES